MRLDKETAIKIDKLDKEIRRLESERHQILTEYAFEQKIKKRDAVHTKENKVGVDEQ